MLGLLPAEICFISVESPSYPNKQACLARLDDLLSVSLNGVLAHYLLIIEGSNLLHVLAFYGLFISSFS